MTDHPPSPIRTDSAEAALDAGLAAAFAPEATDDYQSRAAGFIPAEVAGTIIAGKYKLLERIGEGGMGSVWMAQQTEPVKRHVAVKLIKTGMDSKQVLARFEAERQALAVMDHPNISKILDGGVVSDKPEAQAKDSGNTPSLALQACHEAAGRPYFVMELVKGVPITKYCDEHKLTPRQRLELFVPVCQAIQHAHQKGIIHRDIKPSNVMVALYDDKPIPKVIDFGVAKATGHSLTGQTLNTGFGGIVGTPEYMSPEQASLNNLDIDTRSDIYSLGVLLYELLAGSPPFKRKELEQAGLLEILRVIREDEPPRPSTKLSTADALPSLSANRGTEPKKLTGILRNELDWIVMKALEKDRARRYETANGFAADINRYLVGEPVNAHPPSAGYRLSKFAHKHRTMLATATAFIVLLITSAVVSTLLAVWARRAERDAVAAMATADERAISVAMERMRANAATQDAQESEQTALKQIDRANKYEKTERDATRLAWDVHRFFAHELIGPAGQGPMNGRTPDVSLRVLLDRAGDKWGTRYHGSPRTEATIRTTIGQMYRRLGLPEQARPHLERALELWRADFAVNHDFMSFNGRAEAIKALAGVCADQGDPTGRERVLREFEAMDQPKAGARPDKEKAP